jgi:hypothetical protein
MATSPNYGWLEPDNTDLVKNGALAIRTLGNAIDTTMATMVPKSIVDAKGDLIAGTAADTAARLAVGNNGETLVADSSTSTGLRYQASQAAAKNCIINGGMDIWQRGTSITGSGAYVYNADRWEGFLASTYSVTRIDVSSLLNNFQYGLRGQRASGQTTTNYFNIEQGLETSTIQPLRGNIVTVSFWARCGANFSPTSSQMGVTLFCGTGTERVRNVTAFTSETTPINTNATLTTTYQKFTFTSTAVPTTTTQAALTFSAYPTGTAGANDWFEVTGVQMEVGSVATAFTRAGGTIQGELAACKYYYQRIASDATSSIAAVQLAFANSTTSAMSLLPIATMRTTPSVGYSAVGNFYLSDLIASANYTTTAIAISGIRSTQNVVFITHTVASGLTSGRAYSWQANTTSTYFDLSAEL